MQTFLPVQDYHESGYILDKRRCWNQVNESLVIHRTIQGFYKKGWQNHPIVKMWRNYPDALAEYHNIFLEISIKRGVKVKSPLFLPLPSNIVYPPWLGNEKVHSSHRANLLRKDPVYYGQFGWVEEPAEGYFWVECP